MRTKRTSGLASAAGFVGGAGLILLAAFAFGVAMGEGGLRSSFETALREAPRSTLRTGSLPISGSEEYWLSAVRDGSAVPVTKTVSVGDEIAFGLGGERRTFKVQSVSEFAPPITEIDTRSGQSRFILVTAQDAKMGNARLVRFLMEIDARAPETVAPRTVAGRSNRAL